MDAERVLELLSQNNLFEIQKMAEEEIRDRAAKNSGGKTLVHRLQSASKYLARERGGSREALGYAWKITFGGETYQCLCNGFTGFFLKNFMDIPEREEPAMKNFQNLIPNRRELVECEFSQSDVETTRKLHNAKQSGIKAKLRTSATYKVGNSFYDIDHITDCINILGGNIVFRNNPNNQVGIALLESENGMAILLPLRMAGQEAENE